MLQVEAYAVTLGDGIDEKIVAVYFLTDKDRAETHAAHIDGNVRSLRGMQGKSLLRIFTNDPRGWVPRLYL